MDPRHLFCEERVLFVSEVYKKKGAIHPSFEGSGKALSSTAKKKKKIEKSRFPLSPSRLKCCSIGRRKKGGEKTELSGCASPKGGLISAKKKADLAAISKLASQYH
eukprot:TRINITY_DN6951_c0_g1_i1.p1 TRINITY_DN6951_c0_g1~~TRINITY_DN6951_c0_g1_i1.p1  ORF type:complete len:106 (-),score=10.82 TRINITY_DN6951_c0_g1_i1:1133-1450(-)